MDNTFRFNCTSGRCGMLEGWRYSWAGYYCRGFSPDGIVINWIIFNKLKTRDMATANLEDFLKVMNWTREYTGQIEFTIRLYF